MEQWARIPGFRLYEASDLGNIRNRQNHRLIAQFQNPRGYMFVQLGDGYRMRSKTVHTLVDLAFNGDLEDGMIAVHIDRDRTNNRLDNLRRRSARSRTLLNRRDRRSHALVEHPIIAENHLTKERWRFPDSREASFDLDVIEEHIHTALYNLDHFAGGYEFRLARD